MKKPIKQERVPIMDYNEMIGFVEEKYNIEVRGYLGINGCNKKEDHFDKYQRIENDPKPFGGLNPDVRFDNIESEGYEGWTVIREGKRVKATKEEYDADFKILHDHYQRYHKWCEKNPDNTEPEYLDYWHWMTDRAFDEVRNGCEKYFPLADILEDVNNPEWVKEITQLISDEFKDDLDSEGGIDVWIEW